MSAAANTNGLTQEQLRAGALARVNKALAHIQRAQDELASACGELSALNGGIPVWTACHKMTDKVRAFWYRVERFRNGGHFSLDSTNVEALARRLAEAKPSRQAVQP